jgi:hypothetical protein
MSKPKLAAGWLAACAATLSLAVCACAAEEKPKTDSEKGTRDIEFVEEDVKDEPTNPPIRRRTEAPPPDAVKGFLLLSNGDRVEGDIHLTRDTVLKFYHTDKKTLLRVRLDELTHIEQQPTVERMEKEWRWLENANDQKVYTGREYPLRQLDTTLHMKDGRTLKGELTALIFVTNENGRQRFILHKRQKGDPGQKLSELLYVKLADFRVSEKKTEKKEEPPKAK